MLNQCFVWPLLLGLGTVASAQVCLGTSDNTGTNIGADEASADARADPSVSVQSVIAKKMCFTVMTIGEADTHFNQ